MPTEKAVDIDFVRNFEYESGGTQSIPDYPMSGGSILRLGDGTKAIFISNGSGQSDGLFIYDKTHNKLVNIIDKTNLNSLEPSYGSVSFDLDDNGYIDLIIARKSGVYLFKNNGTNNFDKSVLWETDGKSIPLAIAVSDYNRDGIVDLYVSKYVYPGQIDIKTIAEGGAAHIRQNVLFKGLPDGEWEDVTTETNSGGGKSTFISAFVDLNNDRYPELVLAQDGNPVTIMKNVPSENDPNERVFQRLTEEELPYSGWMMGIGLGDVDFDGDMDIYMGNISTARDVQWPMIWSGMKPAYSSEHILLRNDGNFQFTNIAKQTDLEPDDFQWGSVFQDVNRDSYPDLLIAKNSFFLRNINKYTGLRENTTHIYNPESETYVKTPLFKNKEMGHGPLIVDINDDGAADVIWLNMKGPVHAYLIIPPKEHNFINVLMPDNLQFANAVVQVKAGGKIQTQHNTIGGTGLATDNENILYFGLGEVDHIEWVKVTTQDGQELVQKMPSVNQLLILNK